MKGKILTQTTDGVEIVDALVDYPGALKSIIWGLRTSKEDKAAIRDLLKNASVMYKQAVRARGEFRISIEIEKSS